MVRICPAAELGAPSIAQLYIDSLRRNSALFSWVFQSGRFPARGEEDLKSIFSMIYKSATRTQRIHGTSVFLLREHIHPALWFHTIEQSSAARRSIRFIPRKDTGLCGDDTLGALALGERQRQCELFSFAEKCGVGASSIRHYCYRGAMRRTPSFSDIVRMSVEIPPESWFIYPDEVSDSDTSVSAGNIIAEVMEQEKSDIKLYRQIIAEEVVSAVAVAEKSARPALCGKFLSLCYSEAAERCGILGSVEIVPCGIYTSVRWKENGDIDPAAGREFYSLTRCKILAP